MQWKVLLSIVLVVLAAFVGYQSDKITTFFQKSASKIISLTKKIELPKTPPAKMTYPQGVASVKAYAAYQYGVPEDKVTILSSSKKLQWDSICLGLPIQNYDCKKSKVAGYEVAIKVGTQKITYRGSEDGKIIRVVKE